MKKNILLQTLFFSFAIFLASCSNGLTVKKSSEFSEYQKTYISISKESTVSARFSLQTIEPVPSVNDLTSITLTGTISGSSTPETLINNVADFDSLPSQIAIAPGTWSFTLTAQLDGVIFSSTLTDKEIAAGSTTPLSFELTPQSETNGGLNIKLLFPKAATCVFIDFRVKNATDIIINKSYYTTNINGYLINPDPNNSNKSYIDIIQNISTAPLEPGIYALTIKFSDADLMDELNSIYTDVYISAGITTTYTIDVPDLNDVYSITYKAYEGTSKPTGIASQDDFTFATGATFVNKYSRNSETINLPNLTLSGYVFKGWYDDSGNKIEGWTSANPKTGDLVLYARWEALATPGIDIDMEQSGTIDLTKDIQLSDSSASDSMDFKYNFGSNQTYHKATLLVTADTSNVTGITISSYKWYVNGVYYPSFINVTETTDNSLTITSATKNGTTYSVDTSGKTLYLDIPSLIDDDDYGIINYGTKINVTLVITVEETIGNTIEEKDYSISNVYTLTEVE
ncbi:MAG: InlB B-repeat-containing protein [Treponema sp.]|nr:InlB B-repeat-containing protein [Treponema sp.]